MPLNSLFMLFKNVEYNSIYKIITRNNEKKLIHKILKRNEDMKKLFSLSSL